MSTPHSNRPDVVFYETFEEEEAALRRLLPDSIQAVFVPKTIQEAGGEWPAKLISTRTQSAVPVAWLPELSGILSRSSGCDHLFPLRAASDGKVALGYLPLYCARAVAEQGILLLMALLRKLKRQLEQFDRFDRNGLTGVECAGRRLLVVGVGQIGREVVALGRGLGMTVRGVDIVRRLPDLKYTALEHGLAWADAVICALPLTAQTRGLLNRPMLEKARLGTLLVNVGRGEATPLADLSVLLESGRLGGVGLDVYEEEGKLAAALRSGGSPTSEQIRPLAALKGRPDVLLTPHNAFNTVEALERKAQQSVEAVVQFLKTGTFPHPAPDG
ncbi:MAG: hydroxyacid dehydrogenase [Candidatus Omnitrophica bacterium CG11_big_fil_rev_8_21_14_0_20_64_10]|nr:MAG: hydroxyacid dehydrogenase [Candidatus Omnitrophica bacterium CG11_big_fil_rev_8_21_14_0_20_64_10]